MPDKKATAVVALEGWPDDCVAIVKRILRNQRFSVAELVGRRQSRASLLVTNSVELAKRLRKRRGASRLTVVFFLDHLNRRPEEAAEIKRYTKTCRERVESRGGKPNVFAIFPNQLVGFIPKIAKELFGLDSEESKAREEGFFPNPATPISAPSST